MGWQEVAFGKVLAHAGREAIGLSRRVRGLGACDPHCSLVRAYICNKDGPGSEGEWNEYVELDGV